MDPAVALGARAETMTQEPQLGETGRQEAKALGQLASSTVAVVRRGGHSPRRGEGDQGSRPRTTEMGCQRRRPPRPQDGRRELWQRRSASLSHRTAVSEGATCEFFFSLGETETEKRRNFLRNFIGNKRDFVGKEHVWIYKKTNFCTMKTNKTKIKTHLAVVSRKQRGQGMAGGAVREAFPGSTLKAEGK